MRFQDSKRYALLLAVTDSDYVKKVYGGYFNVFMNALADEGENWDLFRVVDGEFPKIEELRYYDGFVVSGSPSDAFGDEGWIIDLCFLLQTLISMKKKVLGVCFGHQILCRALGGKVARSETGWDVGIRRVSFATDFDTHILGCERASLDLAIIECHQDGVIEVPKGARVLASSEKTAVEIFAYGDHVLGIQGHPEYTKDILENLIDRLLTNNSIDEILGEKAKLQLEETQADRKHWEMICRSFLKGTWLIDVPQHFENVVSYQTKCEKCQG